MLLCKSEQFVLLERVHGVIRSDHADQLRRLAWKCPPFELWLVAQQDLSQRALMQSSLLGKGSEIHTCMYNAVELESERLCIDG